MSSVAISKRGFPFFLARPRTALERLRLFAAKQVWAEGPVWKRAALIGSMAVGWPSVGLGNTVGAARQLARENGVPFLARVVSLYSAALARNIPPHHSSFYQIMLGPDRVDMSEFLIPADQRILTRMGVARGAVLDDVQDKLKFERICREHGLACVATLASFDHGRSTSRDKLYRWRGPVFVKALRGNKGAGAEKWMRSEQGFLSPAGEHLDVDAFISRFRDQSCIVQPVLEDHEALRKLGSVALSSVRIVTARGIDTPATAIAALLSLANKGDSVISHPGTMCGLDVEEGAVIQAGAVREKDRQGKGEEWDALLGTRLPFWHEAIELVRRAHDEAFPAFLTLGWDVALTPEGPILLETNAGWSATQHQIRTGPLGETALAGIIDELLLSLRRASPSST